MRRVVVVLALLCGVLVAPATAGAAKAKLVAFSSCRALVSYAHHNAARAGGIGVPVRALTDVAAVPILQDRDHLKVVPYTVDDEAVMQRVIDLGVDGIISDDPDLLGLVAKRNGLA